MPRLAVLSDTHVPVTARLTRMVVDFDPEVLLFAGDHHPTRFGVSRWSARAWRRSVGPPLNDAVVAVPGNHDYDRAAGLEAWHRTFSRWWPQWAPRSGGVGWFLTNLGDLRVIGLDTGPQAQGVSDEQLAWLEGFSPETLRGPVICLAHAPLAPVSAHIGRSQDHDPERRDRLAAALSRLGVRLYLCGHEHLYAHRIVPTGDEPIHQITVGGGGASGYRVATPDVITSASVQHIALVDVTRDMVTVTALDVTGREVDVVRIGDAPRRVPGADAAASGRRATALRHPEPDAVRTRPTRTPAPEAVPRPRPAMPY